MLLLDVDHGVTFSSQPETFRWSDGIATRRWTPDLRVAPLSEGLPLYLEIKPYAVLAASPDLGGRVRGMVERCAERGAGFAILTEREIRVGTALAVARNIRAAAGRCDPDTTAMLLDRLSPVRLPKPLGMLGALFVRQAERFAMLGLLGRGFLRFDPALGLGPATMIHEGPHQWR